MVRWEAALIAVFGTVTGLAVGMFLGWAMVFAVSQEVETAEFVVPYGQLGAIVAVAAVCGVVAALLPARGLPAGRAGGDRHRLTALSWPLTRRARCKVRLRKLRERALDRCRQGWSGWSWRRGPQMTVRWKFWNDFDGVGPRCPW